MRRCFLHIGHPKTATTYLQHCLHLNEALFRRHNYWLPSKFERFGSYDLAPLARDGAVISGNLAPMHALMSDGPAALIAPMKHYLFAAPDMPAECDVLLSSELFFYYPDCTAELARSAMDYGLQPEVVVYLPRQDRAVIAGYLQNVRNHGFTGGVIDFLMHDRPMQYYRYAAQLERLAAGAPGIAVTARTFDPAFLKHGNILDDFLTTVGCPFLSGDLERPERASNPGLHLEQYEMMRAASLIARQDCAAVIAAAVLPYDPLRSNRIHAHYYRPYVRDFVTELCRADNAELLSRFLPAAGPEERAFWLDETAAEQPAMLDDRLLGVLFDHAFR